MIGIYKITNLINGKFYIGSSVQCNNRRKTHFSKLKSGTHDNKHIQNSYNKHGKKAFKFEIIEVLADDISILDIEKIEADYLKKLKPHYNKTDCTIRVANPKRIDSSAKKANLSEIMKAICNTPEFKSKMSKATINHYSNLSNEQKLLRNKHKIGIKMSKETRQKLSDLKKGKKHSEQTKLKRSLALKAYWKNKKNNS